MDLYHITHVDNLPLIIAAGGLHSDRQMRPAGGHTVIGFDHIKDRRLQKPVPCHPGATVGDFVPFYFCPRSVMLFVIEKRSSELAYKSGQQEIVHLVTTVEVAAAGRDYAFTGANAGTVYNTDFRSDLTELAEVVDLQAVHARYWQDPAVKERKQAEFLVRDHCPWEAILRVGTFDAGMRRRVLAIVAACGHAPVVDVERAWYY